jgi:large subunit ribosomal protein L4
MTEVSNWSDGNVGTVELDASSLGDKVKLNLMRDVVRMYEANKRQGTVKAKTRAETNYTENKPFKQKGTGNARRGDRNSPLLRGGGVIFGPRPRDYSYRVPRKALREALRSSLVGKLRDAEVGSFQSSAFSAPSTKQAARLLADLGCDGSAAVVVPSENETLWLSFRNIPRVSVIRASDLNTYHVLWHRKVLFVDDAWAVLMARLGNGAAAQQTVEAAES